MTYSCSCWIICLAANLVFTQTKPTESLFDKTLRSCVFIMASAGDGSSRVYSGTGSFVGTRSGYPIIVTNYHVIASCLKLPGKSNEVIVMFPMKNQRGEVEQNRVRYLQSSKDPTFTFRGRILAYSKSKDLALVELLEKRNLPKGVTALPLAANSPRPGSRVHTIGNTGAGGMWSYTEGNVRSVYDKQFSVRLGQGEILQLNAKMIESSNPTNQGDSGGPLVNDEAELVGVTQGGITNANQLSTFIDVTEVRALLQQNKIQLTRRMLAQAPSSSSDTMDSVQVNRAEMERKTGEKEKQKLDPREAEAASKLRFAQRAFKVKDYVIAEQFLLQIIRDYDETAVVTEAKTLLEQVRKAQK